MQDAVLLDRLKAFGSVVRQERPGRWRAQCPAHHDRRPSLSISVSGGRLLINCFRGCDTKQVLTALGLTWQDIFGGDRPLSLRRRIAATYPYQHADGTLVAEKIRFEPKLFRWRRPDPTSLDGVRWGIAGVRVPLYRMPYILGAQQVVVVEGEKSVDCLADHGIVATCGPWGANRWTARLTEDLWGSGVHDVVVLPDNDEPGRAHGDRVAAACAGFEPERDAHPRAQRQATQAAPSGAPMRVKLVAPPGLFNHGDVVDWLMAGHTAADLQSLIESAPYWTPEQHAETKRERTRRLTRERVRRFRRERRSAEEQR